MKVFKNINSVPRSIKNTTVAIGNFDGIHLGHQKIFTNAFKLSRKKKNKFGVFTFDPAPKDFFTKKKNYNLNLNQKKIDIFQFKPDFLYIQKFNTAFSKIKCERFIENYLVNKLKVKNIFVGNDFRFGFRREGNIKVLKKLSKKLNFKVFVQEYKKIRGKRISSSWIRDLLSKGNVKLVSRLLGRPWMVSGDVITGNKIGRKIKYPTANLKIIDQINPLKGVYAVKVMSNNKIYSGVANFGIRPTIGKSDAFLEVYIFNKKINLYKKKINVFFIDFIRKERKFKSLNFLKLQIDKDIMIAKRILK